MNGEKESQSRAEELHHECSPASSLDKEARFSAKLRRLIERSGKETVPLSDCIIERLEETGHVKEKF